MGPSFSAGGRPRYQFCCVGCVQSGAGKNGTVPGAAGGSMDEYATDKAVDPLIVDRQLRRRVVPAALSPRHTNIPDRPGRREAAEFGVYVCA